MDVLLKKLDTTDVPAITKMVHTSLREDFPYKKETIKAYCGIYSEKYFTGVFSDEKNTVFGAYENDKFIGVIVLKPNAGGVVYIDWLIVAKEYRGKGVGTTLLEKADEWSLTNKYHYLYLYTETDKNISFYERRGFTYVGKHEGAWFGETEHILEKRLRKTPFPEAFEP